MNIDFQDRIDNYLLDRMSDEERNCFESNVAGDTELKEQLQFTKTVQQATKSRNEKLAAMEGWKDDYVWEDERVVSVSADECHLAGNGYNGNPSPSMNNKRVATSSHLKKIIYWVSGVAAILIVGVFVFDLYSPLSQETANETTSRPDGTPNENGNVSFRGQSHNPNIENLLAMGDYSNALAYIEEDEANIRTELMLNEHEMYSRGESHKNAETEKEAMEIKLARLHYLKAQALIGLKRVDEALVLLDDIRHSNSEYGIKADSLYHLLK